MVARGGLVVRERTFGPGQLGFGEAVGSQHRQVASAQLAAQVAQLLTQAGAHFLAGQHERLEIFAMHALLGGLVKKVIDESGNTDDHVRLELADVAEVALGAHHLAAARAERE